MGGLSFTHTKCTVITASLTISVNSFKGQDLSINVNYGEAGVSLMDSLQISLMDVSGRNGRTWMGRHFLQHRGTMHLCSMLTGSSLSSIQCIVLECSIWF